MAQMTFNIPDNKLVDFARSKAIVQGEEDPNETPAQAFIRLKKQCLWELKRSYIQMINAESQTNDTDVITGD